MRNNEKKGRMGHEGRRKQALEIEGRRKCKEKQTDDWYSQSKWYTGEA
jgi:uncharacterized radical SAM superfamily Fe-S cluster-containing enzyme